MNRAAGLALALLAFPVTGEAITWPVTPRGVSGTFGEFRLYSSGAPRYHLGTDVISCGDPVYASIATNGGVVTNVVILSNNNHRVVVDNFYEYDHLADDATFYAMQQSFLSAQQQHTNFLISEGTIIGTSGNTGVPQHCHLHFQAGVQNVSNDVFNALAFFSNDDTVNGVLQQVSLRQNGSVVIPDIQDGGAYSQTGTAEFVVLGNDLSNASRNVNWARFTSTLDGTQLQDFQFLELGGMPANPADVYSTANPASTFNPFVTWYRMGTTQLAEGQHQICLTGYDFNDTASRVSLGPVCRSFIVNHTPPSTTFYVTPTVCPGQTVAVQTSSFTGMDLSTPIVTATQMRIVMTPASELAGLTNALSQVQLQETNLSGTKIVDSANNVPSVDWNVTLDDVSTYTLTAVDAAGNVTSGSFLAHTWLPTIVMTSIKPQPLGTPPGSAYQHEIHVTAADTLGIAYVRFLEASQVPFPLDHASQLDAIPDAATVHNDHSPTDYYVDGVGNGHYFFYAKNLANQLSCGDVEINMYDQQQTAQCATQALVNVHDMVRCSPLAGPLGA